MSAAVLIVSDRFPSTAGAGAESVLSAVCSMLIRDGRQIDFLVSTGDLIKVDLSKPPAHDRSEIRFHHLRSPPERGVALSVRELPSGDMHKLDPSGYGKIFVFGDENILRFSVLDGDMIAWPDDPPYLVSQFKAGCGLLHIRSRLRALARSLKERRQYVRLARTLRNYRLIVHHAQHHAASFGARSGRPVVYAPPLVPSMVEPRQSCGTMRAGFIHIGHLGGAASLAAIEMLLKQSVRRHFAASGHPLTLVGKADIPEVLKHRLSEAGYRLTGFVDDLEAAMASSLAIVVPGAYAVGSRTRILHALSLGNSVIAHSSCLAGMPELENCVAVRLFDDEDGLTRRVAEQRNLDSAGRAAMSQSAVDFMHEFAPNVQQRWRSAFE